jgi:hypothetical protein
VIPVRHVGSDDTAKVVEDHTELFGLFWRSLRKALGDEAWLRPGEYIVATRVLEVTDDPVNDFVPMPAHYFGLEIALLIARRRLSHGVSIVTVRF